MKGGGATPLFFMVNALLYYDSRSVWSRKCIFMRSFFFFSIKIIGGYYKLGKGWG